MTNRLYRNVGKARFVEVTQQAGLAKTAVEAKAFVREMWTATGLLICS